MVDYYKQLEFYSEQYEYHGDTPLGLGWKSKVDQVNRFVVTTAMYKGGSILDVGCGFGDLYKHLKDLGKIGEEDYWGFDINEKAIEVARNKHAYRNLYFFDILKVEIPKSFNYVVASGIFNIMTDPHREKHIEYISSMLKQMYDHCNSVCVANFITENPLREDAGKYKKEGFYFYTSPEEVIRFCYQISKKFLLRADYSPDDCTVYLLK